jgi:hypothetical protein
VRLGILVGEPARRVDAVQYVVVDVEGEVQALAIVLDVAVQSEILGIVGGRELRNPISDAEELGASFHSPGEIFPSSTGVLP